MTRTETRITILALGCLLGGLAAGCSPGGEAVGPVPPPWDRDVIFLAVDGLDWTVLEPLVRSGEASGFDQIYREGASGVLRSRDPLFSPVVWTTIATGKVPGKHGIKSFTVKTTAGPIPVTSNLRRALTVWDILGRRDREVGVIGWWATWPAEPVNGFMCTDRTWPLKMGKHGWPVTTSGHSAVSGMLRRTYPEDLMEEIRSLLVLREDLGDEAARIVDIRGALGVVGGDGPSVADVFAKDLSYDRIGRFLYQTRQPDFFSVYYEITDIMAHYFWPHYRFYRHKVHGDSTFFDESPGGLPDETAVAIGRNFEKSYLFVDRAVQSYLRDAPSNAYIIIASDHGYGTYPEIPRLRVGDDVFQQVAHWHKPDGVFMIWGPGVEHGRVDASILDIAPTILWLMGLPVPEDMDGKVLLDAFSRPLKKTTTLARVSTYESEARSDTLPLASPEDSLFLERLRSLGYIR